MMFLNELELLEALRIIGRYEVLNLGGSGFVVLPLFNGEILNTRESHEECPGFFHNTPD